MKPESMIRPSTALQGGATPRPLPALSARLRAFATCIRQTFTALPAIVRTGATFLGVGLLGDVGYHLIHGIRPHSHTPGGFDIALVIHLTVVLGMAMCMAGIVGAGIRSTRSARSRREDR